MRHAYWGKGYDVQEFDSFLKQNDIRHTRLDKEDKLLERVAGEIYQGKLSVGSKGDSSGDRVRSATEAYWRIRANPR